MEDEQVLDESQEIEQEPQTFDEGMDEAFDSLEETPEEVAEQPEGEVEPEALETPEAELTPEDHDKFKADLIADGKEKTAQRFDKLLTDNSTLKKQVTELTQKAERHDMLSSEIFERGGIEPDNLPHLVDFFAEFGAGQLSEKSVQFLKEINRTVESRLGVQVTDIDVFSNHADLQDRINSLELTEQDAREMVKHREQSNYQDSIRNHQRSQQAQQDQHQAKVQSSTQSIEQLRSQYKANDPDWAAKEKMIVQRIESRFPTIDPAQWPQAFQHIYEDVSEGIRTASVKDKLNRDTNTLTNNGINGGNPSVDINEDNYVDQFFAQKG
jgi:hypothetical protein